MSYGVRTLVVALMLLVACGSDDGASPPGTGAPTGDDASPAAAAPGTFSAGPWVEHEAPEPCRCADGSEYSFASRTADPTRVVLYFEGGGACFSAETCSFTDGVYKVTADLDPLVAGERDSGILDADDDRNPLRDWSFVYAPYCTGDVHLGDNVHDYGGGLEVAHVGYRNASHALDHVLTEFPEASEILVTGSSAGGIPSPLFAGLVADQRPDARIVALSDASGVYPDNPPVNAAIGELWGTTANVPDWSSTAGLAAEDYSIPGLFTLAGQEHPDITFGRFDNAYDEVQAQFVALAALAEGDQKDLLLANETQIEESGVPVAGYVAAGTGHTILLRPELYRLETEGVSFLDWLTALVEGRPVDDVVCTDCGAPA